MHSRSIFFIIWISFALSFSSCSSSDFSLDVRGPLTIPPLPPASVFLSSTITTNPKVTPWVIWSEGTDLSRTGLDSYEVSVGSSRCASDVMSWTNTRSLMPANKPGWWQNQTPSISSTFLYGGTYSVKVSDTDTFVEGVTYYLNVRTKDLFNQVGTPTCEPFTYSSTGWRQEAYVKPINGDNSDLFGYHIAADGDTMVVAALREASSQTTITNGETASSDNSLSQAGAVYVYRKVSGAWKQEAYIKAPNVRANTQFGKRVAISGDTIAVSSPYESSGQTSITATASSGTTASGAGAVYVFVRSGASWTLQAYIKASNAQTNDSFGDGGLAISGNTIAVGSPGEDSNLTSVTNGATSSSDNSTSNSGAVYVYSRSGTSWTQQAYIKAANADTNDYFGTAISLDNDTLAVGSRAEASNAAVIINGPAASSDNSASFAGAVYVYKRTGVNWAQEAYVKSPHPAAGDYFGESVSVSGDTLAVGAARESTGYSGSGEVYVYKRTTASWALEGVLKPNNAYTDYRFGQSVSLVGDKLAVGSPNESSGLNTIINETISNDSASYDQYSGDSGAVYVYTRSVTTWSQTAYIKARNAYPDMAFGTSIALTSSMLTVGAVLDVSSGTAIINGPDARLDINGTPSGAAYVYTP